MWRNILYNTADIVHILTFVKRGEKTSLDIFVKTAAKLQGSGTWHVGPGNTIILFYYVDVFTLFQQAHLVLIIYCLRHLSLDNIQHLRGPIVLLNLYFTQKVETRKLGRLACTWKVESNWPSLPTFALMHPDVNYSVSCLSFKGPVAVMSADPTAYLLT